MILGLMVIGILSFYLGFNAFLNANSEKIIRKLSSYFSEDVRFGELSFEYPNRIIISQFEWQPREGDSSLFEVDEVRAFIHWPAFLMHPGKSIRKLVFIDPVVRRHATLLKITKEVHHILKQFKPTKNGFTFAAQNITYPFMDDRNADHITGDIKLYYRSGEVDLNAKMNTRDPIFLTFNSVKSGDTFDLKFIEAISDTVSAKFWGTWKMHDVDLKGHIFTNKGRLGRHSIVDINSRFSAYPDRLVMESFDFLLNGVPVNMDGEIGFNIPQNFRLAMHYLPMEAQKKKDKLNSIDMEFRGVKTGRYVVAEGRADVDLEPIQVFDTELEQIQLVFEQLEVDYRDAENVSLNLARAGVTLPGKDQELHIDDIAFNMIRRQGQPQMIRYNFPFYSGSVNGFTSVDETVRPGEMASSVNVYDVDLGQIGKFIYDFRRVQGRLQTALDINSYEGLDVSGYASLDEGVLQEHIVLDWVSQYFDLPNMKHLAFHRLSSGVKFDKEGWKFDNIRLKSDEMNLNGHYSLDSDNRVNSELSVQFPRFVLIRSNRLRPLVKRIKEQGEELEFDFKLTGFLDRVNVRWSPSDLKTEIVNIIPGFIQRKIENGLESSI